MTIEDINRGDKVVYIPLHLITADSNNRLAEENLGVVTSKNDRFVFVLYLGNLRSIATSPEHLYTLQWRQDLADKIPDLPEKTF